MSHETQADTHATQQGICPICLHSYAPRELTKHHLVPKSRKGRVTVDLCRPCHGQIHAVFTEKELERHFDSVEKLLAAEEMQDWIRWIRRRRPKARISTKTSRQKGKRRR